MVVFLSPGGVLELRYAKVFNEFHAVLPTVHERLPDALVMDGCDHVWVAESWLREELTGLQPVPDWLEKYEAMLMYAKSKGWTRESPLAIRAHVMPQHSAILH